jgi:hypothetical protein
VLLDPGHPTRTRLLSLVGLVLVLGLIYLGGIWPSFFTLAAILVLPAAFVFPAAIFRPALLSNSPKLRGYLVWSAAISFLSVAYEVVWLISLR